MVNYELPMSYSSYGQPDFETYMHRIGRTGRWAWNLQSLWQGIRLSPKMNAYSDSDTVVYHGIPIVILELCDACSARGAGSVSRAWL